MVNNNKLLIEAIEILALNANDKREYLIKLFGNNHFNLDEILLEYDDAKFLQDYYNEDIKEVFSELDKLLEKIDEFKLYNIEDLNDDIWNQVRNKSIEVLKLIK